MPYQSPADVTVVIPALNRADVLPRALRSIVLQSVAAKHVIVVDDGSTDATADVARAAGVKVMSHEVPRGSAAARNTAIAATSTEWIAFLDSDDAWCPDHLAALLAVSDGADMVCSAAVDNFGRTRGDLGRRPRTLAPADLFFPENVVNTSGVLLRAALAKQLGGFRDVERAEDLDLWVRVLTRGRAVTIPHVSVLYAQPSRYPKAALHHRNVSGTRQVLQAFTGEGWNTEHLRSQVATRERWDRLRFQLHEHPSPQKVLRILAFAFGPQSAAALARVLAYRRRARKIGTRLLRQAGALRYDS